MEWLFRLWVFLVLAAAVVFPTLASADEASVSQYHQGPSNQASKTTLGVRFDCLEEAAQATTSPCLELSGLRLDHEQSLSDRIKAFVRIDPFAVPNESSNGSPFRRGALLVDKTPLAIVDLYSLTWTPFEYLSLAIEEYGGAAQLPSASDLPTSAIFGDAGWNQTALSLSYHLPILQGTDLKLVYGDGEAKFLASTDPQGYGAFELHLGLIDGLEANIGASYDGNNAGSFYEQALYQPASGQAPSFGFSTQRYAVGLLLNGKLPAARGLKVALGWQQARLHDLKSSPITISPSTEATITDPSDLLIESPTGKNTIKRTVLTASASYRILDTYFFGVDYETRVIDVGSVAVFQPCREFTGTNCTAGVGAAKAALAQSAISIGGGMDLSRELTLSVSYRHEQYDDLYQQFFYTEAKGQPTKARDAVDARLAYNWL